MDLKFLDFEQPIAELQAKIDELKNVGSDNAMNLDEEIQRLQAKMRQKIKAIFKDLTPWQISQLSRHPLRPYTLDYIEKVFDEFHELHGDRAFADDHAIVGGLGRFRGRAVVLIGHQKGRDTKAKIFRNFGMPRPEGYRKALRLMNMAARFRLPLLTFIDTPGAYPGVGAEERGQSAAIARNLEVLSSLPVPIVCTIIGEGGSGGAVALANRSGPWVAMTLGVTSPNTSSTPVSTNPPSPMYTAGLRPVAWEFRRRMSQAEYRDAGR